VGSLFLKGSQWWGCVRVTWYRVINQWLNTLLINRHFIIKILEFTRNTLDTSCELNIAILPLDRILKLSPLRYGKPYVQIWSTSSGCGVFWKSGNTWVSTIEARISPLFQLLAVHLYNHFLWWVELRITLVNLSELTFSSSSLLPVKLSIFQT